MSVENTTELVKHHEKTASQSFLPAIPNISGNRVNSLEDRLSNQERTTAVLLDQAFRIKDGIVSYLQGNKGFQLGEAAAHQLLENHIQMITSIVKKLSQDIEMLERQIKTRDDVTSGTNFAMQSLDHKHLQGVGDLRGRVARETGYCKCYKEGMEKSGRKVHNTAMAVNMNLQQACPNFGPPDVLVVVQNIRRAEVWTCLTYRCDASIAKLSGDINIIRHEISKLEREIHTIQSSLENYANNIEMKAMQLLGKIETSNSEQNSNLKAIEGNQHHELQLLDLKITGVLNDFKEQIQNERKWTENEVRRYEQEQAYLTNQLLGSMKDRMETMEKRMEDGFYLLSKRIESTDKTELFNTELTQVKNDQNKLHARITRFEKLVWNELEEMQNEYRSGFQSIRDSLNALKQIQTTKLKLEEEKFKQDMKKIRQKINELQED